MVDLDRRDFGLYASHLLVPIVRSSRFFSSTDSKYPRLGRALYAMKKYLIASLLALCWFPSAQPVGAETPAKTWNDNEWVSLLRSCKLGTVQGRYSGEFDDSTLVHAITGWTGDCANGLRDGYGALSTRSETIDNHFLMSAGSPVTRPALPTVASATNGVDTGYASSKIELGAFVRGARIGLWCVTEFRVIKAAPYTPTTALGCNIVQEGRALGAVYRKEADGRWQAWGYDDKPVEPPVFLAAGSLETESARLVADARAARVSKQVEIVAETQVLDDLVRGSRIAVALNSDPLDLKTKRVAMILSSHSLTELERYRQMRQGLIDATLSGARNYPSRDDFIALSDPDLVVAGLASGLTPNVQRVVAADDLSVLADGKADYALIVDWRHTQNFNLSAKDYMALPFYVDGATDGNVFTDSASAWLVNRELKAIRRYDLGVINFTNFHPRKPAYENLLYSLANGFRNHWGLGGSHSIWLDSVLKLEAKMR